MTTALLGLFLSSLPSMILQVLITCHILVVSLIPFGGSLKCLLVKQLHLEPPFRSGELSSTHLTWSCGHVLLLADPPGLCTWPYLACYYRPKGGWREGGYGCKVSLLLKCVELPLSSLPGGWLKGSVLAIGFVLLPSSPAGWLWLVGVPVSCCHSKRLQPPITTPSLYFISINGHS